MVDYISRRFACPSRHISGSRRNSIISHGCTCSTVIRSTRLFVGDVVLMFLYSVEGEIFLPKIHHDAGFLGYLNFSLGHYPPRREGATPSIAHLPRANACFPLGYFRRPAAAALVVEASTTTICPAPTGRRAYVL